MQVDVSAATLKLEDEAVSDVDEIHARLAEILISNGTNGRRLREEARDLARDRQRCWRGRAKSRGISVDGYARNLIASAPRHCLCELIFVYLDAEKASEEGFSKEVAEYLKRSRTRRSNLFRQLLETNRVPTSGALLRVLEFSAGKITPVLAGEAFEGKCPEKEIAPRLSALYQYARSPEEADAFCMKFGHAVFDREKFDSLSRKLKSRILSQKKLSRRLLTSDFRREIENDPLSHPDTPESLHLAATPKRNREAFRRIASGSWQHEEVEELILSGAVHQFASRIDKLLARKASWVEHSRSSGRYSWDAESGWKTNPFELVSSPTSKTVREAIEAIRPLALHDDLFILQLETLDERAKFLGDLPSGRRRRICQRLGEKPYLEILEKAVGLDRGLAEKLLRCREKSRETLREQFIPRRSSETAMIDLWLECFDSQEIFREFFKLKRLQGRWRTVLEYFVRAPYTHLGTWRQKEKRGTKGPLPSRFLNAVLESGGDWRTFQTVMTRLKAEDLARLVEHAPDRMLTWLTGISEGLSSGNRNQEFACFLDAMVPAIPKRLGDVLPREMSDTMFRTTLEKLAGPIRRGVLTPSGYRWLLNRNTRGGDPAWLELLEASRERNLSPSEDPALHVLASGILALGGRDRFRVLFEAYPTLYFGEALERLDLWTVVRQTFDHPSLARWLERKTERSKLVVLIPKVRREYRSRPTVAAALEVALRFSLSDARYLKWLALKRWQARPCAEGTAFDDLYRTHRLPKRAGGSRVITAPEPRLKRLQRRLLRNGFDELPQHSASHGFRQGRSIVSNAVAHTGREMVVRADITSFFPSTGYAHVLRSCRLLADGQLSEGAVRLVAEVCCYAGALPTGAPTSPVIGNLVLKPVDASLEAASKKLGIIYTRYADDLAFSGDDGTQKILPFVRKVLSDYGYQSDPKKEHIFRRGRRQVVTGLVVNEKAHVPRRIRRRLRAAVHHASHGKNPHWHGHKMNETELLGRLAFLQQAHPEEASELRTQLQQREHQRDRKGQEE